MKNDKQIALVIPCYNEASRGRLTEQDLAKRLTKLKNEIDDEVVSYVVFVNDGSIDTTLAEIKLFIGSNHLEEKWIVIDNKVNKGKGHSLLVGMEKAATLAPFVGYIDADLSTSVKKMCKLPLNNGTVYYGNRIYSKRQPLLRDVVSHLTKISVRLLTGVKAKDTQCPFKVVPSDAFLAIKGNLKGYRWIYDIELLWALQEYGCNMKEVRILFNNMEETTLCMCSALKRSAKDLAFFLQEKKSKKGLI